MKIVIFGPPGAGKGTQSELIQKKLGFKHVSTGDLFRYHMKKETDLGLKAKSYVDAGNLVPDKIVVGMVEGHLKKLVDSSVILDGFPRNVAQAEILESSLQKLGVKLEKAIFLEVENEMLLKRLSGRRVCSSCGATYHLVYSKPQKKDGFCDKCDGALFQRKDDFEEVIQNRLDNYKSSTEPLKKFYMDRNIFTAIDGDQEAEKVFQDFEEILN